MKYALLAPVVMVMLMYTSSYASEVKDVFTSVQKAVHNQDLTFHELTEKYYKEILDLAKNGEESKIRDYGYGIQNDKYIMSMDEVAKVKAYDKHSASLFVEQQKKEDTYGEKEKEWVKIVLNKYNSYEEYLAYQKTDAAVSDWESGTMDGVLRLAVKDMKNLTKNEQKRYDKKMEMIKNDDFFHTLLMTDGKMSTTVDSGKKDAQGNRENLDPADFEVPFAYIDEVPLFEGCEPSGSQDEDKDCTSQNVAQFVNTNFNTYLATELGLTGRQRINVIFKIGPDGKVKDVMSRAPHPELEAEAIRVIKSMPDFIPGKQKGDAVTVPYSLPILFQVRDDILGANQNSESENGEGPFVALDEVLIFSDGQVTTSNQSDYQSAYGNISRFVSENFNTITAKEHNLTGKQRINIIFKIGADGKIENVQARASHPALETEGKRVINAMPDFILGKQKGKAHTVNYSLPIVFQVQGNVPGTDQKSANGSEQEYLKKLESKEQNKIASNDEVPYAVVDEVPLFPSCEALNSNEERKICTSDKISSFANEKFNTNLAKALGLTGKQRITVIFKINEDGSISNIKSRAPHPDLEKEAIRVIEALPKMTPGKQKGKAVVVPYMLPILFQVQ